MGKVRLIATRSNARVFRFTNKHPLVGPAVFGSATLYFFVQIYVAWNWRPPYSLVTNAISDLGNSRCGLYRAMYVCSTRHTVMNIGFVVLGLIMAFGSWLIFQEFSERTGLQRAAAKWGFSMMALAGAGTILVGLFPENSVRGLHLLGAGLAIGLGNVAIITLGVALELPESLRKSMILMGAVSLTALVLFATHRDLGIGAGSMERVAAYPETIWLIRFGLYMTSSHHRRVRVAPAS